MPLCCVPRGSPKAEDVRDRSDKDAERPHFTDTDCDLCADKKSGKGWEADTRLPHASPLAIFASPARANLYFLSCLTSASLLVGVFKSFKAFKSLCTSTLDLRSI